MYLCHISYSYMPDTLQSFKNWLHNAYRYYNELLFTSYYRDRITVLTSLVKILFLFFLKWLKIGCLISIKNYFYLQVSSSPHAFFNY